MAEEQGNALPETLRTWVNEQAARSDEDTTEVLSRAVALYRLVEERARSGDGAESPVGDFDDLVDQVATLDRRVSTVESDIDEKIRDVRERVVQIKREADQKAPTDHDHPDIRERVERAETAVTRTGERVEDLDAFVDRGFENYEEILEYLTDETEAQDEKLTRLVSAVIDLRRRVTRAERAAAAFEATTGLKRAANRQGETSAKCSVCENRVAIGLLTEPNCPHCETSFTGIESTGRFFGSATLTTERRPALTAGDDPKETEDDDRVERGDRNGRTETDGTASTISELFERSK